MAERSAIEWTDSTWNPVNRVHQGQPGLQALLCRADHGALRAEVSRCRVRPARPALPARGAFSSTTRATCSMEQVRVATERFETLKGFLGIGNAAGPIWFIGLEEAGF